MSKHKTRSKHYNWDSGGGWNNRTQFATRVRKTRQTIWRWERAGLLPACDGRDPFGNPLWRDSTIDGFLTANSIRASSKYRAALAGHGGATR